MQAIESLVTTFAFFFGTIFSISNPLGCAVIFNGITAGVSRGARKDLARRIAVYACVVLIAATWAGGLLIQLFGISLPALRIAGGFLVAAQAWRLLDDDGRGAHRETTNKADPADALVPLTIPLTTGPGTIAAAIAVGAGRPSNLADGALFLFATTAAALAVSASIAVLYGFSDQMVATLGSNGARIAARLSAFLLLCIAVEIVLQGLRGALG
jgi:multiple antibiotic resistance protein